MAGVEVSTAQLRKGISGILKGADLSSLTAKVVRRKLEELYNADLSERKKEIDGLLMRMISEQNGEGNDSGQSESSSDDDSDDIIDKSPIKKSKLSDEMLARKLQASENLTTRRSAKRIQKAPEKRKKPVKRTGEKSKKSAFGKEMSLSADLAELLGQNMMARAEVVKRMWQIIRERKLEDPKNKRFTICDEQLERIMEAIQAYQGIDKLLAECNEPKNPKTPNIESGRKRFMTFSMMKYLKKHVKDPELLSESREQSKSSTTKTSNPKKKISKETIKDELSSEEEENEEEHESKLTKDDDDEEDDEDDNPEEEDSDDD